MKTGGYIGKILDVDLSTGTLTEEALDESLCRHYIGGYGVAAYLLYQRIPAGADPLGPHNILGFMTGPLTGTPALIGSRFTVLGKSPKTHTWGDANGGGHFGPHMKFAGFDGILVSGVSERPAYLFVHEGRAELRDATHLWGKNVHALEEALKAEHGQEVQIASIGTSGEHRSLLACVMTDGGRAAGRSGLGALMGAKKLKAIVVKGNLSVPLGDAKGIRALRREYLAKASSFVSSLHDYGTCSGTAVSAKSGDSPVKNWGGAGPVDFPTERAEKIAEDAVVALQRKRYGCWGCPIRCGGWVKVSEGEYALSAMPGSMGHKPEYETLWSFGTDLLNDNLESIVKANEICNEYSLDTISVGATIAFAIECFEEGVITARDTDGLELTWGNHSAIVALAEKIARREGLGDILADGVKVAAEKLGHGAEQYAIHVAGEELPGHDPKFMPALATTYLMDATPGRHTQGGGWPPPGIKVRGTKMKYVYEGQAEDFYRLMTSMHVVNSAGLCMFGHFAYHINLLPRQLTAVTGWDYTLDDVWETGMRIATMRHIFNLREGHNPLLWNVPGCMVGDPPLQEGKLKGITIDHITMRRELLEYVGWHPQTTIPSEESLRKLGMEFLLEDVAAFKVPPA
ncbi:MAG TPA: aldehyde ferredoxin oxidoreductase family protein [Anaerolineae bacterium]|nr:aldehyde ferredoxin oxidoreductase family protein [Anaerolineae bacterium]